jgi:hypothetical protein
MANNIVSYKDSAGMNTYFIIPRDYYSKTLIAAQVD